MVTLLWIGFAGFSLYALYSTGMAKAATVSNGNVSNDLLNQVETFESFSPTAYPDGSSNGVQLYSIGYGHQIQPSESYLLNATLTQQQAEQLLTTDLQAIADILNTSGIVYTDGQFAALVDFGFSSGTGALTNAVTAYINSGSPGIINYLQNYVYWHPVPGGPAVVNQTLVNRRNSEIELWNS